MKVLLRLLTAMLLVGFGLSLPIVLIWMLLEHPLAFFGGLGVLCLIGLTGRAYVFVREELF